jgi:glycerol uptake facilitator-like aquaporin
MTGPSLAARLGAEFLGTFLLVFGGCGAAILAATFLTDDNVQLGIGLLGVSLAFGLSVLAGAYAFGHVSGGHFNPAVTIGLAIAKRFEWKGVLPYIGTQIVAASVAGAVLFAIAKASPGSVRSRVASPRTGTVIDRPAVMGSWPGSSLRSSSPRFSSTSSSVPPTIEHRKVLRPSQSALA